MNEKDVIVIEKKEVNKIKSSKRCRERARERDFGLGENSKK